MKAPWGPALARLDALSNRERMLVGLGVVAVLCLLGNALLLEPVSLRLRHVRGQLASQGQVVTGLEAQKQELRAQLAVHPDAALESRLRGMERELADLDRDLATLGSGLVAPERMAGVIKDLLARSPRLALVSLRNLPVTTLEPQVEGKPAAGAIWKHGIEITLEGSWPDLVDYAARLEGLPVRMLWGRTRIDAGGYPRIAMTLTLYTLSLERTWLTL